MRTCWILTMVSAASLMGCSTPGNRAAVPDPNAITAPERSARPTRPPPPGPGNRYGAPDVTEPLDVARFLPQPCTALTADRLRELNLPVPGEPDTESKRAKYTGPACVWQNGEAADTVGVSFMTGNKNGLADLYWMREAGDFNAYWIEITIEGYPGVIHDATDGRPSGRCNIAVGISNTLAFRVGEHGRLKNKSCDRAVTVAAAVVRTLKGSG